MEEIDHDAKHLDNAMSDFSEAAKFAPQNANAFGWKGSVYYRKGDYAAAIAEGHKAERLRPNEQLVHTNLSLFYMRSGDKKTAEHHGLQARIASWKGNLDPPSSAPAAEPELEMAKPKMPAVKVGEKFPEMPWKKNKPL